MLRAPFGRPQKTPYLEPSGVEQRARDRAVLPDGRAHLPRAAIDGERARERGAARGPAEAQGLRGAARIGEGRGIRAG